MAQHYENRPIDDAVELLRVNGFDGLAEAVTVLLNSAMLAERSDYLGAAPYELSVHRTRRKRSICWRSSCGVTRRPRRRWCAGRRKPCRRALPCSVCRPVIGRPPKWIVIFHS
jgi:hypothetical protein